MDNRQETGACCVCIAFDHDDESVFSLFSSLFWNCLFSVIVDSHVMLDGDPAPRYMSTCSRGESGGDDHMWMETLTALAVYTYVCVHVRLPRFEANHRLSPISSMY